MYVRCPRCKSEISFEPSNMSSLGDRYKIKCPNCGATIGAKLPTEEQLLATPNQAQTDVVSNSKDKKANKVAYKSGAGRNIVIFIISLAFVVMNILSFLTIEGIVNFTYPAGTETIFYSLFGSFAGISYFKMLVLEFTTVQAIFAADIFSGVAFALQIAVFVLAVFNLLASFICLCSKHYSRAYNFVSNLLLGASAVVLLFLPVISGQAAIAEYFQAMFAEKTIGMLVYAILGFLSFFFSVCFLGSLKKKTVEAKADNKNGKTEKVVASKDKEKASKKKKKNK